MTEPKNVIVKSVNKVDPGTQIALHDFQICSSDDKGNMFLVDFEVQEDPTRDIGYEIKPGIWRVSPKSGLQALDLPPSQYFETDTAKELLDHMNRFVEKQEVYKKLNIPCKRGLLLSSSPGQGKSSLIKYYIQGLKARTDVCTLMIDNQDVSWDLMTRMFVRGPENNDVNLIVLIIEDIGGSELDERARNVESDMLNFLEGNDDCFKVPTLIIGTTNFINELGDRLVDRPGRFDMVIQVQPPKDNEVKLIVEGLAGRPLTREEEDALFGKGFTPAYCKEIIVRSMLYDIPVAESAHALEAQRKKARERNHGKKNSSLGFRSDDDF